MSADGRPETTGSPDCSPQTGRSDLILNVSKGASISPTWAPAIGQERSFVDQDQCSQSLLAMNIAAEAAKEARQQLDMCLHMLVLPLFSRRCIGRHGIFPVSKPSHRRGLFCSPRLERDGQFKISNVLGGKLPNGDILIR